MRTVGQPGVQVVHARRLAQAVQALGCRGNTVERGSGHIRLDNNTILPAFGYRPSY